ncbi:beta-galactosidase-1-like protein 2 [Erpetoichthys calabaricus]|uniref:beta-galactosidase-1-like protein 2 n=1 Tax=Erpetoichthys calabaricus TaxID=27687 RepID=UPI002233FF14|nr:beta-galactosidase-1-like protein 2 [Erpetoichthys calabaricus]
MLIFSLKNAHKKRLFGIALLILGIIIYRFNWRGIQPSTMKFRKMGLKANTEDFRLEGHKFRILGGSMHYFRVPRAYWKDRMLKMKACGLNTLTTYVAWNLHEPQRGVYNFKDNLDVEAYIRLAGELGLWVILRPGPYICSEWDLGGLPSWLLRDPKMELRTTYKGFTDAVDTYFDVLLAKMVPLQYMKGGPIIAVQVENEYGSYATDSSYMPYIKQALLSRGIGELLLTSDNIDGLMKGNVDGVLATVNLQKLKPIHISSLESHQPHKPKMVMEFWTGWFDAWGDLHHVFNAEEMANVVMEILKKEMSINLYMFHGGTNFGFMSGAIQSDMYMADITSYDYDAPLSEGGDYTTKYTLLRDIFSRYHGESLPDMPGLYPKMNYDISTVYQYITLWEALKFTEEPFLSEDPINMENLPFNNGNGQSYGYTLYETIVTSGGTLHPNDKIRDRALVFIDEQFIGILKHNSVEMVVPDGKGKRKLRFVVENCGRVNYGKELNNQRKGIIGDILLNGTPLKGFTIYSLEMQSSFIERLRGAQWKQIPEKPVFPGFFRGILYIDGYPGDTFVKMPGWTKGVLFINGHNLGRYWSIGPQQSLYLPGPWLQRGINNVIVFEEQEMEKKINFVDSPDLGMAIDVD